MRSAFATAVLAASIATGSFAAEPSRDDLRREQAELHEALLKAPTDPALMVAYARVAVRLGDYDGAIATLERALIYEPDEPVTHLELGVAYFRIGSLGVSEQHLERARAEGLQADLDARAALYLGEIAARAERSRFSGTASAGIVGATNANRGPRSEFISFFGVPARLVGLATAEGDVGAQASLSLRHEYDFQGSNTDALVTELDAYSLRFVDETEGAVDSLFLTVGPRLSLDDSAFGPKVRPFARVGHARVANDPLFTDLALGATLSVPVDDMTTAFGEASFGRREFHSGFDDLDSVIARFEAGASVRVAPRMTMSGAIFGAAEFTDGGDFDNQEVGLRAAISYSYDPNLEWADGLWTLTGRFRTVHRFYDDPIAAVDPNDSRNDFENRFGLSHLFRIRDGFGVRVDGDYFVRDSNFRNFDFNNLTGAISVVYEF